MRASSSYELFKILEELGVITIRSLLLRVTGSVVELFDSLEELRKREYVEVEGDVHAVKEFIETAKKMELSGHDNTAVEEKLFEILEDKPEVANATIRLTTRGLSTKSF